jgi:hypothetical protein
MRLHRRAVLRGIVGGALATLALPSFELELNGNGTARADGAPMPKRFGLYWWGNGVRLDKWIPSATGVGYPLSEELLPLKSVQDYVSVVSGTRDPFAGILGHHDGWSRMTTGSNATFDGAHGNGTVRAGDGPRIQPSFDQIVAAQWKGATPFDSVHLIVSEMGAAQSPNYCVGISTKGQANGGVNPGLSNPLDLFNALFNGTSSKASQAAQALAQAQGNVLGAFMEDAKALKTKLGKADQARLDQYLSSVNDIDARLKALAASTCVAPSAPPDTPNSDLGHEALRGRGRLLVDVLTVALTCDITRVFSIEFSPMQATTIYRDLGSSENYHTLSHIDQSFVNQVVIYNMGELAYLLGKLAGAKDASGVSILDSACIFASSDVAEPDTHATSNMPILVMGKARGKLKGGVHYAASGEPFTNVLLTAFQALDLPMQSFGYDASVTTTTIPALRA